VFNAFGERSLMTGQMATPIIKSVDEIEDLLDDEQRVIKGN
jgi:hypothetical protein